LGDEETEEDGNISDDWHHLNWNETSFINGILSICKLNWNLLELWII
jgi:hypothetical protein